MLEFLQGNPPLILLGDSNECFQCFSSNLSMIQIFTPDFNYNNLYMDSFKTVHVWFRIVRQDVMLVLEIFHDASFKDSSSFSKVDLGFSSWIVLCISLRFPPGINSESLPINYHKLFIREFYFDLLKKFLTGLLHNCIQHSSRFFFLKISSLQFTKADQNAI